MMRWTILLIGLTLAVVGSAGASALVVAARSELAQAISRRLRGADESFDWLAETEDLVVVAMALSSLGVALVGVAIPAIFDNVTITQLGALLMFLVVPAMLLGGYLLPRWLTRPRAPKVVALVKGPLGAVGTLLRFVLPSGEHPTSEDVRALAREGNATATGFGSGEELALVGGVMTFAERPVREVMTPRTDVVAVAQDIPRAEILTTFTTSGYSRLPVFSDTLDNIVGMVHAFDLFKLVPGDPLPLRPVVHAPESLTASDLLIEMQRERRHLAVVMDEFGGTAGIVTLEDLLESLVGEISDEDEGEVVEPAVDTILLEVDGSELASRLTDHFGVSLPAADATTIAGLLVARLGRIPHTGERFHFSGLELDIIEATPARINRLLVRREDVTTVQLDRGSQ